jgi:hypothetical protein
MMSDKNDSNESLTELTKGKGNSQQATGNSNLFTCTRVLAVSVTVHFYKLLHVVLVWTVK